MIFNPFIFAPILLTALFFIKNKSRFSAFINISIVGLYIIVLYKQTVWPEYGSYYLKYVFLWLYIISTIPILVQLPKLNWFSKTNKFKWIITTVQIILLSITIYYFSLSFFAHKNLQQNIKIIDLKFPLKNGTYYISQGGSSVFNNHSNVVEKYAVDIIKLNNFGRAWNNTFLSPKKNINYNIFQDTVYSPINGFVKYIYNNSEDHDAGNLIKHKGAKSNIIELQTDEGYKVVLAHLLINSMKVKVGDSVVKGQPIALVGNSGYSKAPHLHIHSYKTFISNNGLQGESIIISFDGKVLEKNDIIKK